MTISLNNSPDVLRNIHLRIGALDHTSVNLLRQLLSSCPTGADVRLLLDLSQSGLDHDMTLFALIAEKARPMRAAGGTTSALTASARLTHLLIAIGVTVSSKPTPRVGSEAQHLSVGVLSADPDARQHVGRPACSTCA